MFLLLLFVSDLFLWRHSRLLAERVDLLAEANQTLLWQAETAILQSEKLYLTCQKFEDCRQGNVPPLNVTLGDLPTVEATSATSQGTLIFWLACQAVLVPLWFAIVLSYHKLSQRYESLKFDYQNLLESLRRYRR